MAPRSLKLRLAVSVLIAGLLAGCVGTIPVHDGSTSSMSAGSVSREMVRLTPAQECAVGYDLAQQIYQTVSVNGTPIRLARSAGGFIAVARLPGFVVTRAYRPGEGGVYALSPVSVRMSSGER